MAFLRMLMMLGLTLAFRAIENANKIKPGAPAGAAHAPGYLAANIAAAYNILNIQLSLSIGSLGVLWGSATNGDMPGWPIFFILLFTVIGAICRGLVSNGAPQTMTRADWDWRFGVIIPTGLGLAALGLATSLPWITTVIAAWKAMK